MEQEVQKNKQKGEICSEQEVENNKQKEKNQY